MSVQPKLSPDDEASLVVFLLARPKVIPWDSHGAGLLRWPEQWLSEHKRTEGDELRERLLRRLAVWERARLYQREVLTSALDRGFLTEHGKVVLAQRHNLIVPVYMARFTKLDEYGRIQ